MNAVTTDESLSLVAQPPAAAPAPLVVTSPASMMMSMVERGATLDQIERMMALQMQYEAHEAKKAFVDSMAQFKTEPVTIFKRKAVGYATKEGDFVGYKHAELSDVTEAVSPAMARHGLSYRWDIRQGDGRITVACIVTHRSGHSESIEMNAAPDASGKKNAIQQIASAVTYLQRYTLLAITGMSTKGEDDDAASSEGAEEPPPRAAGTGFYPAEKFAENLPVWREVIAKGRKTADQIISMAQTKHPLSNQQMADIRA